MSGHDPEQLREALCHPGKTAVDLADPAFQKILIALYLRHTEFCLKMWAYTGKGMPSGIVAVEDPLLIINQKGVLPVYMILTGMVDSVNMDGHFMRSIPYEEC